MVRVCVYLTDVTEREVFRGRVEEREALVFYGELVGVVDAVVAGGAEDGLVGGAEDRSFVPVADIALDLHLVDQGATDPMKMVATEKETNGMQRNRGYKGGERERERERVGKGFETGNQGERCISLSHSTP